MRKRILIVIVGVAVGLAGRFLFPPPDREAAIPKSPQASLLGEVAK